MADIGTAYVQIEPSAKGISKKIEGEMSSAGSSGGKSFGSAFSGALGGAVGGLGSIVAGIGKAAAGALAVGTTAVAGLAKSSVSAYKDYEQLVGGVQKLYGNMGQSLTEYAQSVGKSVSEAGSEYYKLEAAQNMLLKNAQEAYKTAGMSANEYMETATSFSAALISSLGGDTVEAAKQTDVAMRAISDNVNTFGSDMSSVTNAFQGFAKGQYNMLDNLKLGYGGTKEEMQRLIKDANEWGKANGKASNLSIDSFADVVTAIEQIQEKQNIAGTTGREAMKTIEGSMTATKAAWANLVTAIGSGEGIETAFSNLSSVILGEAEGEGLLNQIIPRIQTVMEGIGEFVGQAAPLFTEKISELINAVLPILLESGITLMTSLAQGLMDNIGTIADTIGEVATMLIEGLVTATEDQDSALMEILNTILAVFEENYTLLMDAGMKILNNIFQGIINGLPELLDWALTIIETFGQMLIDNLPMLITSAFEFIKTLALGIAEALPDLIPTVIDIILTIVESLLDNIDLLIDAAIALIMGLAEGLINALPVLIEKAPIIVQKLVDAIIQNLPKLIVAAGQLVAKLVVGIVQNLPQLIKSGIEIITSVVTGIVRMLVKVREAGKQAIEKVKEGIKSINPIEWGKDLIDKFVQGIKNSIAKVKDTAKEIAQTVKDYIGFSEPEMGPLSNFHTFAPDMIDLFVSGLKNGENLVKAQMAETFAMPTISPSTDMVANYEPVETTESKVLAILNQYLPIIAQPDNITVGLEPDSARFFKMMQYEAARNTELVGV